MCACLAMQMILIYDAYSTKSTEAFVQGVVWAGHCLLRVRCPRKAMFPIRHRLNLRIPVSLRPTPVTQIPIGSRSSSDLWLGFLEASGQVLC